MIHPEFSVRREKTVSWATRNTNRLMDFQLGDVRRGETRREGRFRGNHRRTANSRALQSAAGHAVRRENLLLSGSVACRSIVRGGSVRPTRGICPIWKSESNFICSQFRMAKLYFFFICEIMYVLFFILHIKCYFCTLCRLRCPVIRTPTRMEIEIRNPREFLDESPPREWWRMTGDKQTRGKCLSMGQRRDVTRRRLQGADVCSSIDPHPVRM